MFGRVLDLRRACDPIRQTPARLPCCGRTRCNCPVLVMKRDRVLATTPDFVDCRLTVVLKMHGYPLMVRQVGYDLKDE
jgi:hypothetical protein